VPKRGGEGEGEGQGEGEGEGEGEGGGRGRQRGRGRGRGRGWGRGRGEEGERGTSQRSQSIRQTLLCGVHGSDLCQCNLVCESMRDNTVLAQANKRILKDMSC
jgi:hypothetical protein